MPDDARLWIYATDRALTSAEKNKIRSFFEDFIAGWHSHGRKVSAAFDLFHSRFIVIAANIPDADISGCGIDASVHALDQIARESGFSVLSGLHVFYRNADGDIVSASRPGFRKLVRSDEIKGDTPVFDTSLNHLRQLRQHRFELPARDAWHATVFRIPADSPA